MPIDLDGKFAVDTSGDGGRAHIRIRVGHQAQDDGSTNRAQRNVASEVAIEIGFESNADARQMNGALMVACPLAAS